MKNLRKVITVIIFTIILFLVIGVVTYKYATGTLPFIQGQNISKNIKSIKHAKSPDKGNYKDVMEESTPTKNQDKQEKQEETQQQKENEKLMEKWQGNNKDNKDTKDNSKDNKDTKDNNKDNSTEHKETPQVKADQEKWQGK